MKNTVLTAFLLFGATFAGTAQEHETRPVKSPDEIAKMRTERMTESLGLSSEQQEAVYALNVERAEKAKASRAEMRAKMTEMRAEREANTQRLNEILTEEQREILKEQLAARKDTMKIMRHPRKGYRPDGRRFRNRHDNRQRVRPQVPDTTATEIPRQEG